MGVPLSVSTVRQNAGPSRSRSSAISYRASGVILTVSVVMAGCTSSWTWPSRKRPAVDVQPLGEVYEMLRRLLRREALLVEDALDVANDLVV